MATVNKLLGLLFLIGFVYPTVFSDYLLPNETLNQFTTVNYTLDNITYTIYMKDDQPVMMFKDDQVITNSSQIEEVLSDYYRDTFAPSEDELNTLKDKILMFNQSRNDPTYYPSMHKSFDTPEDYCDRVLYLEHSECSPDNEFGCKQLGNMICGLYGEGCDPYLLGDAAFEYVTKKEEFDDALQEVLDVLDQLQSSENLSVFDELSDAIDNLRDKAEEYREVKVRLPVDMSECDDCIGVCPEFTFNYTVLDEAEALTENISQKIQPYLNRQELVSHAQEETEYRVRYYIGHQLQPVYQQRFNNIRNEYSGVLENAREVLKYVKDPDLEYYYQQAADLDQYLNTAISTYNVSNTTEQKLNMYEGYLKNIQSRLENENLTSSYERFKYARDRAVSLLIKLKWSVDRNDDWMVSRLNELGTQYNQYEEEYNPPMTPEEYDQLYDKYEDLSEELNTLLAKTGSGSSGLDAMVYRFSSGVSSFVSGILHQDTKTARRYRILIPSIVLLLLDVILVGLAVLLFRHMIKTHKGLFMKRSVLTSWTVLLVLFVLIISIGSIGIYSVMKHTLTSSPYTLFEQELFKYDTVNLIVDYRGSPSSDVDDIESCTSLVEHALEEKGFTVNKYTITGDTCTDKDGNTYSPEECYDNARESGLPTIELYYSSSDIGHSFSIAPDLEGSYYGTGDTFQKCEIGYVLKHSHPYSEQTEHTE